MLHRIMLTIREATTQDQDAVWAIFHEVVAAGDTYVFDPKTPRRRGARILVPPGGAALCCGAAVSA